VARKPLLGRSFQPQQTTPRRWPFSSHQQQQRPSDINTDAPMPQQQDSNKSTPQPTTPPPVDENLKPSNAFELAYQALGHDDDVFVDEEKENSKEENSEDVEELFFQKVGKSIVSPPVSPEKPMQKLMEIEDQMANRQLKPKNKFSAAGRRLEFPLPGLHNTNGRRDFFGILLPDSPKPTTEVLALSDSFTGQIKSTPIQLHNNELKTDNKDVDELPPYSFCCDDPKAIEANQHAEVEKPMEAKIEDRVVPTRLCRNSVSLCLDSDDLKAIENEDYCATDGDYTEEEDEADSTDFGPRFPSFKRRLRKRKPVATVRNAAVFFLAEKRAKDAPDMLMLTNVPADAFKKRLEDHHCVPSISI
jgi:hypothetical protein